MGRFDRWYCSSKVNLAT